MIMTDSLFEIPETLSPRLEWEARFCRNFNVTTQPPEKGQEEWTAITSQLTVTKADSEAEALRLMAAKLNEPYYNHPTKKP